MKKILFCAIIAAGFIACGDGNNTASEGYIDSTNATPNSTVNPPETTMPADTSLQRDTTTGMDTVGRSPI